MGLQARISRVKLLMSKGDFSAALEVLGDDPIEGKPYNVAAFFAIKSALLYELCRYVDAYHAIKTAIDMGNDDPAVLFRLRTYLAGCYSVFGHFKRALAMYSLLYEESKSNPEIDSWSAAFAALGKARALYNALVFLKGDIRRILNVESIQDVFEEIEWLIMYSLPKFALWNDVERFHGAVLLWGLANERLFNHKRALCLFQLLSTQPVDSDFVGLARYYAATHTETEDGESLDLEKAEKLYGEVSRYDPLVRMVARAELVSALAEIDPRHERIIPLILETITELGETQYIFARIQILVSAIEYLRNIGDKSDLIGKLKMESSGLIDLVISL